jgi:hypothetical protein
VELRHRESDVGEDGRVWQDEFLEDLSGYGLGLSHEQDILVAALDVCREKLMVII